MNSFKQRSVKIYNIKELLVLSLVLLKQKIYTTKKAEVRNTLKSIRDQNIHQSWLINTNHFHFMAMRWYIFTRELEAGLKWMKRLASRTAREGKNEANTFLIVHFFALNACNTETDERLSHANASIGSNISAPTAGWSDMYIDSFPQSSFRNILTSSLWSGNHMANTNLHMIHVA